MSDAPSAGERPIRRTLRVGAWIVDPAADQMAQGDTVVRVEARTMRLLLCLAHRAGDVVSIDELLSEVWAGVIVTPDSVYQAITSLRRLLGDDPKQPAYIATVPRRGYRLIASVDTLPEGAASAVQPAPAEAMGPERGGVPKRELGPAVRASLALGILLLLCGAVSAYWWLRDRPADAHAAKSIAVLPFLDLTDAMNEEPFADGMTEELIVRLSKVPGLRVSAPTAAFQFKDKQVPVPEIARSLGVSYLLDGSVRKSERTLRVSVRLLRADDGFVVWSDTYDRAHEDKLAMQDEIAGEVTSVLARLAPPASAAPSR